MCFANELQVALAFLVVSATAAFAQLRNGQAHAHELQTHVLSQSLRGHEDVADADGAEWAMGDRQVDGRHDNAQRLAETSA